MSTGTCTVHTWNDGARDDESDLLMGSRVNHQLVSDPAYYSRSSGRTRGGATAGSRLQSQRVGRTMDEDESEEEAQW